MQLSSLKPVTTKKINSLIESRFGFEIDFNKLDAKKTSSLIESINKKINQIRQSSNFHNAEKDPRYTELLVVKEGLTQWKKTLVESQVTSAEILLAGKDQVDSIQDVIEKVGKMQNEQLPQLLDSVRDQMGQEVADSYKNTVLPALTELMTQLQSTREAIDTGSRILAGEDVAEPMSMPGDEFGDDTGLDSATDLDMGTDDFSAMPAEVGGTDVAGRAKRA